MAASGFHFCTFDTRPPQTANDFLLRGNMHQSKGDFAAALEDYNRAIELDPNDSAAYFNRGINYTRQKKFTEALADFTRARVQGLNPSDFNIAAEMSEVCRHELTKQRASIYSQFRSTSSLTNPSSVAGVQITELPRAASLASTTITLQVIPDYDYGNQALMAGWYAAAIEFYKRIPTTNQNYRDAGIKMSRAYYHLGDFSKAIEVLSQSISSYSLDSIWCLNAGLTAYMQEQYASAIEWLSKAIALDKRFSFAYFIRGNVYQILGALDDARSDYIDVIRFDPQFLEAHHCLGVISHLLRRYDEASYYYNRALMQGLNLAEVYFNRAMLYRDHNLLDEAEADINEAIKRCNPSQKINYILNRGIIRLARRDFAFALVDFNEVINCDQFNASAHFYAGQVYEAEDDKEQAIKHYCLAVEKDPTLEQAHYRIGMILNSLGDMTIAISSFTRAIEINAEFANAYYQRGRTYLGLGHIEFAIGDFNAAIRLDPTIKEGYLALAEAYSKLNMRMEADAVLQSTAALTQLSASLEYGRKHLRLFDQPRSGVECSFAIKELASNKRHCSSNRNATTQLPRR